MVAVLFFFGLVSLVLLLRTVAERRERVLYASSTAGGRALTGTYTGSPDLASLEHLEGRRPSSAPKSPYRVDALHSDGSDAESRRRRARTALSSASWLLMSAVEYEDEAVQCALRGDVREADVAQMHQNRAELEAMQCVFEAEDCLGIRIVRQPGEERCFARYYGQAGQLQAVIARFCDRAFGGRVGDPALWGVG